VGRFEIYYALNKNLKMDTKREIKSQWFSKKGRTRDREIRNR